jgi:ADP-ribosylglycohydrolase
VDNLANRRKNERVSRNLPHDHAARVERAERSLNGLSLGDAFGQCFFRLSTGLLAAMERRELPESPWTCTDDTVMALSIFEMLEAYGTIDQDVLARAFATKYAADPNRGYGAGAHRLLHGLARGADWRSEARAAFAGSGSYGNGGAMRVAPLGAYFAGDLERVVVEARRSAEVTHAHPEGIAGAVAVAVAAACAATEGMNAQRLVDAVLQHTPDGETRRGIVASRTVRFDTPPFAAADRLGSGALVSAQDTVPFVIWCSARHLDHDFEEAMWNTVAGLGDLDTTCAMVGGILSARNAGHAMPAVWLQAREPLSEIAGAQPRAASTPTS